MVSEHNPRPTHDLRDTSQTRCLSCTHHTSQGHRTVWPRMAPEDHRAASGSQLCGSWEGSPPKGQVHRETQQGPSHSSRGLTPGLAKNPGVSGTETTPGTQACKTGVLRPEELPPQRCE